MIYKISSFLAFLLIQSFCFGQSDSLKLKLDFIFSADRYFPNENRSVYLPNSIQEIRANNSGLGHDFNTYTDIPQLHASIFAGLLSKISLKEGYNFHFDLLAEDRGQSFGSLALNKVTLFPRIYGSINDTIKVGNQKIVASIKAGDIIRYQHNHGLTVNNVDVQGATIRLSSNKIYFDYTLIADISQHVGLNIEEFYSYKIGYQIPWSKSLIDVAISYDKYAQFDDHQNNMTVNSSIELANSKLFIESAYNLENRNSAVLVGLDFENKMGRFHIKSHLSYRFYSRLFNDRFLESSVRYRDLSTPTLINNSVGDFLYPLINSYRPFDQWSVYTEYGGVQLHAARVTLDTKFMITSERIFHYIKYEGLPIHPSSDKLAFYNFFESGFGLNLPANSIFQIYVTNKIMNLDIHYQTFYQAKTPILGFSLYRLLEYE